jgi:hypothetical protein
VQSFDGLIGWQEKNFSQSPAGVALLREALTASEAPSRSGAKNCFLEQASRLRGACDTRYGRRYSATYCGIVAVRDISEMYASFWLLRKVKNVSAHTNVTAPMPTFVLQHHDAKLGGVVVAIRASGRGLRKG